MQFLKAAALSVILLVSSSFPTVKLPEHPALTTVFSLPASLEFIEEEAFAGSGVGSLDIFVPEAVSFVGETAFDLDRIVLHGSVGSYADDWAQEHSVPFVPDKPCFFSQDLRRRWMDSIQYGCVSPAASVICLCVLCLLTVYAAYRSRRPKDRPELLVLAYWFP